MRPDLRSRTLNLNSEPGTRTTNSEPEPRTKNHEPRTDTKQVKIDRIMSGWQEFTGLNRGYVLELYEKYRRDPSSVDRRHARVVRALDASGG